MKLRVYYYLLIEYHILTSLLHRLLIVFFDYLFNFI